MKKRTLLLLNILFICSVGHSQEQLIKPNYLNYEMTNGCVQLISATHILFRVSIGLL